MGLDFSCGAGLLLMLPWALLGRVWRGAVVSALGGWAAGCHPHCQCQRRQAASGTPFPGVSSLGGARQLQLGSNKYTAAMHRAAMAVHFNPISVCDAGESVLRGRKVAASIFRLSTTLLASSTAAADSLREWLQRTSSRGAPRGARQQQPDEQGGSDWGPDSSDQQDSHQAADLGSAGDTPELPPAVQDALNDVSWTYACGRDVALAAGVLLRWHTRRFPGAVAS